MNQQKAVVILLLNVTSLVCAQYGSPAGISFPGYGGIGTRIPSGNYQYKRLKPVNGAGVSDGNSKPDYMHQSNSDAQRVTGKYGVLLSDGRYQIVKYVADENGYNAQVSYEGEAKPQLNQTGNLGSQKDAPPSAAPSHDSAAPAPAPDAPAYSSGGSASGPVSPGYSWGSSGSGTSEGGSGGSPPFVPSYIVRAPSFQNGIKVSSHQKQGNQYE